MQMLPFSHVSIISIQICFYYFRTFEIFVYAAELLNKHVSLFYLQTPFNIFPVKFSCCLFGIPAYYMVAAVSFLWVCSITDVSGTDSFKKKKKKKL